MSTTSERTRGGALRALSAMLLLALLAALLLAGSALAAGHEGPGGKSAAKPGRPTAKAPSGTIPTATPTFAWSKARGATRYEVRVYEGSTLLLHKTGIKKLSWQSSKALPTNVALTWKVRAGNAAGAGAWSRSLTFKIVPPSPEKALTAFSFQGLTPPATGVILETLHTVALTVPAGTNVTALVATFATTGVSVAIAGTLQVSGTTANNFSNPVTYTVTAGDGTTQAYVVTVTVAANPARALTAFSFQGLSPPVVGTITEAAHTIALTVPAGTNVTALVATFTTTGASVAVAGTPQVSATTPNNFTSPVTYTVTAADASTQAYVVTVTAAANPAKALTAFSFQGLSPPVVGTITEAAHTIALTVPAGTNLTALIATFTTTGASVAIAGTLQASGTTANNFSNPVTYTVTAADGTTQAYVVTVTVAASPAKALTAFSFQGLAPPVTGTITEAAHTIALTVPAGTNVTALVATFTTTGASVAIAGTPQVSGTTANNFSNPVTYTVTAGDGTTQAYVVTVTVATPAKAITAFSFQGLSPPVIGTITEAAHTIALTVPAGTDVTALVATFTTTGASVAIEGTPQVSGLTANNFTNPVPYTVTAGDASTGGYTVTVTFAPLAIGDSYQGGKIAYVDATGQHGLIVAAADQNAGVSIAWSNITATLVGTGTALGAGQANTTAIVGQVVGGVSCTSGAAYLCDQLVELGYHDWYLPSKDELNQMYVNRAAIGGVWSAGYWSSSEVNATIAWGRNFDSGNQGNYEKRITARVRAVRSF